MRVSVVIPVYNVEQYLARCLDSVLAATTAAKCETEIICVNDGSTDGSAAVLAKYADRVKIITKENGGLGSARNAGLDVMTGDYVTFVDSDDWIPAHALAKFAEVAEASGAALVVSTAFEKSERLTVNGEQLRNGNSPMEENKSAIVHRSPLNVHYRLRPAEWIAGKKVQYCAWNKLYRADLFKARRYPATIYEDFPVTTDILCEVGEFAAIDEPLYVYCTNEGAASLVRSSFTARKLDDSIFVVRQTLDVARKQTRETLARFAVRQAANGHSSTVGQVWKSKSPELVARFLAAHAKLLSDYPEMKGKLSLKAGWRLWRMARA